MKFFKTSLVSATGAMLATLSSPSIADAGHAVPDSVSRHNHMHLLGDLIISPSWLVGIGILVFFAVAIIVKQVRARASKS